MELLSDGSCQLGGPRRADPDRRPPRLFLSLRLGCTSAGTAVWVCSKAARYGPRAASVAALELSVTVLPPAGHAFRLFWTPGLGNQPPSAAPPPVLLALLCLVLPPVSPLFRPPPSP